MAFRGTDRPRPRWHHATTTLDGLRSQPKDALEGRGRGLRDYRLWLGLVLAITTALWYAMR